MKKFKVYTYYWPKIRDYPAMFLAFTRLLRPREEQKIYIVEAETGTEAKRIAIKMLKAEKKEENK